MNRPESSPHLLLIACASLYFVGCGRSAAPESAAPEAAASAEEEAPAEAPTSEDGAEAERVQMKSEAASDAPPQDDAGPESADWGEPGADFDEAPPSSPTSPTQKKGKLVSELTSENLALDAALNPKELSCEGAKPHQDAICSIAARICEMEQPSTTKSKDCKKAEQSCQNAKKRYQDSCS